MAETKSSMQFPLGAVAPDFTLMDSVTREDVTFSKIASATGNLIIFMCNHCPFVQRILSKFVVISDHLKEQGFTVIAISSNDTVSYPADSPKKMKELALQWGFSFPYLFDEKQNVAKMYNAECTPDLFLFDGKLRCVYRGQFDSSTPGNKLEVTGEDLLMATKALMKNEPPLEIQKPSIGCNIKWRIH